MGRILVKDLNSSNSLINHKWGRKRLINKWKEYMYHSSRDFERRFLSSSGCLNTDTTLHPLRFVIWALNIFTLWSHFHFTKNVVILREDICSEKRELLGCCYNMLSRLFILFGNKGWKFYILNEFYSFSYWATR